MNNNNAKMTVSRFSRYVLALTLLMGSGLVQADPPRTLDTSFENYARQHGQHDQALVQQSSASRPAHGTHLDINASGPDSHPVNNTRSTASASGHALPGSVSSSKPKAASAKSSTPVNINTADEASLSSTLTGVGPAKARAIVEYRQQHGPFKQPQDLLEVKGIGPATLAKNLPLIRVQ